MAEEDAAREPYAGGLPPDLWLLAIELLVGGGLLITNIFTPLVLLGVIDATTPSSTVVGAICVVVCVGTACTVILTAVRQRRRSVAVLCAVIVGGLALFFVAASAQAFDGFLPRGWSLSLLSPAALAVHACACVIAWSIALRSLAPAAHLAHYVASTLFINALCCRALFALELADPLGALRAYAAEAAPAAARLEPSAIVGHGCARLVLQTWWFFGLSYGRLRVGVCLVNIALVGGRYVLTDREHHRPTSPLRLALMLRAVLSSAIVLVPLAPILAARLLGRVLFGRAVLDTLNENGIGLLLLRPTSFRNAVRLRRESERVTRYVGYRRCRAYIDVIEGRLQWRDAPASPFYDSRLVRDARAALARARQQADERGDPSQLASLCLALSNRNFGGVNAPENYLYPGVGSPAAVESLLAEASAAVTHVVETEWREAAFDSAAKRDFVTAALHAHGCTALCLSGGGAIALYHLGVVAELHGHGLLPRVISGTSGGSIVAAMLACRTDAELPAFLSPDVVTRAAWLDPFRVMLRRLLREGVALDKEAFLSALKAVCEDYTFAEAFARTGRLVSLTAATAATHVGTAALINHITHPHVLVRSAVQASCALPGVMRPGGLLSKAADGSIVPYESAGMRYRDGSFQSDIPSAALAAQFNATHFIVSQVNAHIVPLLDEPARPVSPLYRLQRFLVDDVRARLHKYDRKGGYLPTELANLVSQTYTGSPTDVTIFPRPRLSDLTWRILAMPSVEAVRDFILGGRRMTWPHVPRIANQTQLERALLHAARQLKLSPRSVIDRAPAPNPDATGATVCTECPFDRSVAKAERKRDPVASDDDDGASKSMLRFPLEQAALVLDAVRSYTTPLYNTQDAQLAAPTLSSKGATFVNHASARAELEPLEWVPSAFEKPPIGSSAPHHVPESATREGEASAEEPYAFSKHRRRFLLARDGARGSERSVGARASPKPRARAAGENNIAERRSVQKTPCGRPPSACSCRQVGGLTISQLDVGDGQGW